ncbi:MAG: sugar phosphate isomerase/epimerase [Planctomycetes bacterium]|nr:sugar phosphate isomerase/epimerase [Planctomycetota bacterium]
MNRRQFLRSSAATAITWVSAGSLPAPAEEKSSPASWPLGCFNRAWAGWSFNAALQGVREAGFKRLGLVSPQKDEPFIGAEATAEYLEGLKKRLRETKLEVAVASIRFDENAPLEALLASVRKQIDNAARAEKRGLQVVLKPHGGLSAGAAEMLRCLEKVGQAAFKIWYDAGNILHYTGKDPAAELETIAKHVTGFCAKDCAGKGGEVMMALGEGKVDFKAVFKKLQAAGFSGPIFLEGVKVGKTPSETTANTRAGREFLEGLLKSF